MPSLSETYHYDDAKPFGSKVAYLALQELYPENTIKPATTDFYSQGLSYNENALYISITKSFFPGKKNTIALKDFIETGNTAVIISKEFDTAFTNAFKIQGSGINFDIPGFYGEGSVTTLRPDTQAVYSYYYKPVFSAISQFDSAASYPLINNSNNSSNCIILNYGRGKLIIGKEPRLFSNYFLLTKNNARLIEDVFSNVVKNPERIIWDDYYQENDSSESNSTLSVLRKYPALYNAFLIGCALLLAYILFNGKRKQRPVDVINPIRNSSVQYAEAIAALYKTKADNKIIADKMLNHFTEFVKSRYFVSNLSPGRDTIQSLSKRSATDESVVESLLNNFEKIKQQATVENDELIALNTLLEKFYAGNK